MDPIATTVARRFVERQAELLTKQWLMGVRRGWLHMMEMKPKGWPEIFKAFDKVREFIDNLEDQVKYVRRGPYSSHGTMTEGEELEEAFKKLRNELAEKRRAATHWLNVDQDPEGYGRGSFTKDQGEHMRGRYEEAFGELLTTYVKTKANPANGQYNTTREAHLTELLDKILEILRKDAVRLQESIKQEKDILDRGGEIDSPTEEVFKDPAFKDFMFGHMKVIVTDPKGNGHYIRPYVRLLDVAHQLTTKKGFGNLWYGTLFLQSSTDYKKLSEDEQARYEKAGYHDLQSTAGEFHSGEDAVVITAPPDDKTIKTIIHELGHRFWFKFMTGAQRARFADLIRVQQPALMKDELVDAETLQAARHKILIIGQGRKTLINEFEDDFRSAADSADVEKVIKNHAPLFKAMVLKDPIFDVITKVFSPTSVYGDPRLKRLYDSTKRVMERYTGVEESAEVKFRRHMLPEALEAAWKSGMSDGLNKWIREANRLSFEVVDAALEYVNHIGKLGERKLDPDESKVTPVSDYGQTNPEEAFAEVFAFYCMNRELTRDQIESFKEVIKTAHEEDPVIAKIDALPKHEGGCAEGSDCVSVEDIFFQPIVHAVFGFRKRYRDLWTKVSLPVKDLHPVQDFINRDTLKKYVKQPSTELPHVVKYTDGRLFAQDHTRIAAQIMKGATHVEVLLIEYTGVKGDPYKKPQTESVSEFVTGFFQRHPKLHRFAPEKVIGKVAIGEGAHPEARQAGDTILLFPKFWKLAPKVRDFVFAHEIGHYVLSKHGLNKLIEGLQARGLDPWVTEALPFGQPNSDEAFAESFATHFMKPNELRRRYPEWAAEVEAIVN